MLVRAAERGAERLVAELGARRVWLFGSLAWGGVHEGSDVDVLVEGLPADAWSAALAILEDEVEAPVDLILADEGAPGLLDRVRQEGVLLHEA